MVEVSTGQGSTGQGSTGQGSTGQVATGQGTVLVTGHHPLLAPALVDRLLGDGRRVVVPVAPVLPGLAVLRSWPRSGTGEGAAPETVEHDPEDPDVPLPLRRGVDLVVHLGTGGVGDDLATRSSTVLDALFALHVAEVNRSRLLLVSVDGDPAHAGVLEGLVAGYRSAQDVDAVLARVTECYGPAPGAAPNGPLARMLAQAGATGAVVVHARDRRRHTPCFVDDAVDGLLRLASRPAPADLAADHLDAADVAAGPVHLGPVHLGPVHLGPVHLGPATGLSTAELAEQVARATGAVVRLVGPAAVGDPVPVTPADAPVHAHDDHDDPRPGGRAPWGWRPRVDLTDGLRRCLADRARAAARPSPTDAVVVGRSGVA